MTAPARQPPAWILTEGDWNRLKEHLVIGCTNQQKFLESLRPLPMIDDELVEAIRIPHTSPAPALHKEALHCDCMGCKDEVAEHDAQVAKAAREQVLDEMVKLSMMIETNETERWESCGRPKNDGYINGSHSGYGHALRDMRRWIDKIKKAESLRAQHPRTKGGASR